MQFCEVTIWERKTWLKIHFRGQRTFKQLIGAFLKVLVVHTPRNGLALLSSWSFGIWWDICLSFSWFSGLNTGWHTFEAKMHMNMFSPYDFAFHLIIYHVWPYKYLYKHIHKYSFTLSIQNGRQKGMAIVSWVLYRSEHQFIYFCLGEERDKTNNFDDDVLLGFDAV
jgi:hypothetical protein